MMEHFLTTQQDSEQIWQAQLTEGGCFVLAEAALNDAVPWLAERCGGNLDQTRLYWGDAGRIHASISPYCFPVDAKNWPQVREHLIKKEGWGVGIQLESFLRALPVEEQLILLIKHLRQWSLVATPEGETAILRISDWRVIKALLSASSAQEASAFFGPISSFSNLTPAGEAHVITLSVRDPAEQSPMLPRELSDAQWRALLVPSELETLSGYMAHLREHHGRWRDSNDETLLAFVRQQSQQAKAHGFTYDQDIVRYLALATELEPLFITTPWAQSILQQPEFVGEQSRMDRLYRKAIEQLADA